MQAPTRSRGRKESTPTTSEGDFTKSDLIAAAAVAQSLGESQGGGRRPTKAQAKRIALYGGIAMLGLLALVAWKQPPRSKGDYPAATFMGTLNWFFYPYEVNPWYRPPVDGYDVRDIAIVPDTNGQVAVAVVGDETTLRTKDGGKHWVVQKELPPEFSTGSISFADLQDVWITGSPLKLISAGSNGKAYSMGASELMASADGGTTWRRFAEASLSMPNTDVHWVGRKEGIGIYDQSILTTADAGATWHNVPFTKGAGFSSVASADASFSTICAVVKFPGQIACSSGENLPHVWQAPVYLTGIAFSTPNNVWAVGTQGGVFRSRDGGITWDRQLIGTQADLNGVVFADGQEGWIFGLLGTILHTTNGGATWKPQESAPYRRYPAPWFFLAMVLSIWLFAWATAPEPKPKAIVDDIVSSDAPVESVEDDRLGQRALIERLTNFLTNPNTVPPLVISLQAPWGMGKSSMMRMLEANLRNNRAAVTVWFNAWHHQKEDQLLAYLLETVQRQAVPQWLSRTGVSFRLDLIRVRLFDKARRDRLAMVLAAIGFVALRVAMPVLFPPEGWGSWLTKVGYIAVAGVFIRLGTAFKSNPEKLTENAGGFLVDTFKEAARLPSLVGKSDVRQEFSENLKDVAEALKPQRLVIFLDDLDRCQPEQVVQILEAINFLSSAASVFVIVGADYTKVETLVANQFEYLALREAENAQGRTGVGTKEPDPVLLRVGYARNYLKKIVNIRLNLKTPQAENFREMMDRPRSVKADAGMFARYGTVLATLAAPAILVVAVSLMIARANTTRPEASVGTAAVVVNPIGTGAASNAGGGDGSKLGNATKGTIGGGSSVGSLEPEDGRLLRNGMLIGIPALLGLLALIARLARPANLDQAQDDPKFKDALVHYTDAIFKLHKSPREVRRLLNYLRLVAARTGQAETDQGQRLREAHPKFDKIMVGMAVHDKSAAQHSPAEVRKFYEEQCAVFGLDPTTFEPMENWESSAAEAGHVGTAPPTREPSSKRETVGKVAGAT
jgi:photosystem II stability/assembly factor-like uncharacterized protein